MISEPLKKIGGITSTNGAEIAAFDGGSDRLFVVAGSVIEVQTIGSTGAIAAAGTLVTGFTLPVGTAAIPNSVAVKNGIVAVAYAIQDTATNAQQPGRVSFYNAATGAFINSVTVGALPDMLTFTADGTKVLVANEGEPNSYGQATSVDPEGSVSIINLAGGAATATVQTADFTSFNSQMAALKAAGVRITGPGSTVAQDLEPEYIAIAPDGLTAWVTLQENNAIATLDIATAKITSVSPLGAKDYSVAGNGIDASDRDLTSTTGKINIQPQPAFGLYQPDAIASFTIAGQAYYITANEGDARDYTGFSEEARVGAAGYVLDPVKFPTAATLKQNANLGRLTVSNATGDTDGDGDFDRIESFGARSFSIWDATGKQVFDSGDQLEQITATQVPTLFNSDGTTATFDGRSDNKGPEPEGVVVGVIGNRTYAFIGLERTGDVMVYDVTVPTQPKFVQYINTPEDTGTEGLAFVSAADSPTGKPLLVTANEVSKTVALFEISLPAYTLQLLHYYGESGLLGVETAPIMGALIDKFDDQYANTLVLGEGDSYIPGPWLIGGSDPSLNSVAGIGTTALGRPDIAIMNAFGTDASALGNHEFDLGSPVVQSAIAASGTGATAYPGALFPFITANLNFAADSSLRGLADATLGGTATNDFAGKEASAINGKIAPYAVVTQGGEQIGIVGATTYDLLTKTSPNGTVPKDDGIATTSDLQEVAAYIQASVDALKAKGINKIVLVDQLDTIERNKQLAPLVSGIDVMVAGGGHERLGDANDTAVGFNGHSADFLDTYPIVAAGSDGKPTLIVTTDTEYSYLGRLVVDFTADGEIIVPNLDPKINGAYASTQANLQAAYGSTQTAAQIVASSPIGSKVNAITDAINKVIIAKDGNIFGYTKVYIEGDRAFGRAQEVNFGNISADANIFKTKVSLGSGAVIASLKNGGGLRASVGAIGETGAKLPPAASTVKPAGAISQLDVENALRFDNKLIVFDTTPQGLLNILNYAAGLAPGNGGFAQVGGVRFSYDPTKTVGQRVQDVAIYDLDNNLVAKIADNGVLLTGAPEKISVVTLNFTANGGDGYPIKANAENFRYLLNDGTLSAAIDEALDFTAAANLPANALGEQKAFEDYLKAVHGTPEKAYNVADTPAVRDQRIQNLQVKGDTVLSPTRNDFNGDGKSDILFRNTDGSVATWQMNGATPTPSSVGTLPAGWSIAGTGDFSGDRNADLLLNNTDGRVVTWQLSNSSVTAATNLGTLGAGWSIAGTGDFNGDGTSDALLKNTNGTVATWQINASTVTAAKTIGTLGAGWSIAGTGDFNGDGTSDVLLTNTDGSIAQWQISVASVIAAKSVGKLATGESIAGIGDFNGDGKSDLLFRNTSGSVAQWQLNGETVTAASTIGSATADWKIAGTGDLNGDNKADLLWRNDNGGVASWQMNGSAVTTSGGLTGNPIVSTSWQIAAPML
jgi:2',3'-cyclic-nucleotide 2'-phosphodiesterase (5'-nucleotidase family)